MRKPIHICSLKTMGFSGTDSKGLLIFALVAKYFLVGYSFLLTTKPLKNSRAWKGGGSVVSALNCFWWPSFSLPPDGNILTPDQIRPLKKQDFIIGLSRSLVAKIGEKTSCKTAAKINLIFLWQIGYRAIMLAISTVTSRRRGPGFGSKLKFVQSQFS